MTCRAGPSERIKRRNCGNHFRQRCSAMEAHGCRIICCIKRKRPENTHMN